MGSPRTRRPDIDTIAISGGDTLTVKRYLTAGEFRGLIRGALRPVKLDPATLRNGHAADVPIEIDPTEVGLSTVLAYLLDWTFTDFDGQPIVIRDQPAAVVRAALDAIDAGSYAEVQQAIQAHDTAVRAFAETEKK